MDVGRGDLRDGDAASYTWRTGSCCLYLWLGDLLQVHLQLLLL